MAYAAKRPSISKIKPCAAFDYNQVIFFGVAIIASTHETLHSGPAHCPVFQ
jgi:hypothetical protein